MITTIKGIKGTAVRAKIVVSKKRSSKHWINRLKKFIKNLFN